MKTINVTNRNWNKEFETQLRIYQKTNQEIQWWGVFG
jgi:hypothetical protein